MGAIFSMCKNNKDTTNTQIYRMSHSLFDYDEIIREEEPRVLTNSFDL